MTVWCHWEAPCTCLTLNQTCRGQGLFDRVGDAGWKAALTCPTSHGKSDKWKMYRENSQSIHFHPVTAKEKQLQCVYCCEGKKRVF